MCLECHIYRLLNERRTFHMCPGCHTCLGLAAHIPMRAVMHIPIYVPAHFPDHFPVLTSLLPEVLAHILLILLTPARSALVHSSSFLRLNALNFPFFQASGTIRFPVWRQRNLMYRPGSRSSLPGYLPENHSGFQSLPHYTASLPGQHHTALQP